jgi:hypothetical protein
VYPSPAVARRPPGRTDKQRTKTTRGSSPPPIVDDMESSRIGDTGSSRNRERTAGMSVTSHVTFVRNVRNPLVRMIMPTQKKSANRKYGKKASEKVERAMHEMKRGELKSGRSGKRVTSRKQAIAIGLSEARKAGGKVPSPRSSSRSHSSSSSSRSRRRARSS